jgi:hypothetical protein
MGMTTSAAAAKTSHKLRSAAARHDTGSTSRGAVLTGGVESSLGASSPRWRRWRRP